jgi:pyridoxal phosphate enzyme (YggS family)
VTHITDQLDTLNHRIAAAAAACGRDPADINILAVSKRQPVAAMREIAGAGVTDFGENYVQDAIDKMAEIRDARWHFIGQVQSNKTRTIAERFDWVETIVRKKIAVRLNEQRPFHAPALNVCLQVRLQDHDPRPGVEPSDVAAIAETVAALPRLRLRGLMGMPAPESTPDQAARAFGRLAHIYENLGDSGYELDTLSMGMSRDLEIAIEYGSTQVRVGTALFGSR